MEYGVIAVTAVGMALALCCLRLSQTMEREGELTKKGDLTS